MNSSITQYPKVKAFVKRVADDNCNLYLNLAPLGDACLDNMQKSDNPHYTHMYTMQFKVAFFQYRLRDNEFDKLQATGEYAFECSSFLYQENKALVSRANRDNPEFPACLFAIELKPDGTFKNKTFRASVTGKYSAAECYDQVVIPKDEKEAKQPKAKLVMKPVQNVTPPQPQTNIVQSIAMACLEKYGKLVIDGTCLELPGVVRGN